MLLKLTILILSLSACADRMTVEEKLKHRSIVCVYTPTGEICEKQEKPAITGEVSNDRA